MFSSTSYSPRISDHDRPRSTFSHPSSTYGSPFSASGGASISHHGQASSVRGGGNGGGSSLTNSLSDPFAQSRTPYQPGYLMSMSQHHSLTSSGARFDDMPIVQTKAKMSHLLSRGYASDLGSDSMFQSSSQLTLPDEDGPPMQSVHEIMNETPPDASISRMIDRRSMLEPPSTPAPRKSHSAPAVPQSQQLYVIVFGYPPDRYSASVEYFRSLGETTEPDPNTEIVNCFKLGYKNPPEALRAIRKNGEIINGSWMIGVKWADPAYAESILGQGLLRSMAQSPDSGRQITASEGMVVDSSPYGTNGSPQSTVGTPIKLAPSISAFRRGPAQQQSPVKGHSGVLPVTPMSSSPSKGLVGQMSDLIFGW